MRIKFLLCFSFLLIAFLFFPKNKELPLECENVFSSPLYCHWLIQMGLKPTDKNLRKSHEKLITDLRRHPDPLASKIYSGVDLRDAYLAFWKKAPFENTEPRPEQTHDGLLRGNLPTLYFTHKSGTKVLRFAKPFLQTSFWQKPKLCPLFLQFIKENPDHIYVNVMKRKGQEGPYTKALEALDTIKVFTLDKNSSFYFQKNTSKTIDYQQFKEDYLKELTKIDGNFFWSVSLPFADILDRVHQEMFSGKEILDLEERKVFIELTYLAFLNTIVETLHPPSLNITCHQGMDRGPSLLVLWMHEQAPDEEIEKALFFSPPKLVHNRHSHKNRMDRWLLTKRKLDEKH